MDYLDFEIRIGAGQGGTYPTSVIHSPAGEVNATIEVPVHDSDFRFNLQSVPKARGKDPTRRGTGWETSMADPKKIQEIGVELFRCLFRQEMLSCYRNSLNEAREQKKGLRLRFRIEAPELTTLPWEYLYDESEGDFICLSRETPLIRYIEVGRPPKPLKVKPPIQVLGMVASPEGMAALDVEKEKARMAEAIAHLIDSGFVDLSWLEGQTWRDLNQAMLDREWHILHFIGHGGFDPKIGEGYLALSDEQNRTFQLTGTQLGRLLSGHNTLRLAVLNSCEGARADEKNLFSSTGSILVRRGVPAVVSMQYEITDRAALEFSRTFYGALADNLPVDSAVTEARKAISIAMGNTIEWGTPVLHLRSADGQLFDSDMSGVIFTEGRPPPPDKREPFKPPETPTYSASEESRGGLQNLIEKVRKYWIEGVLEQSIHNSALIELGIDTRPNMVNSPWGDIPVDKKKSIQDIFYELGSSLLILGIPGSGKTTMMLTLARSLLEKAEEEGHCPVPVVANLSSWGFSKKPLADWLTEELSAKYLIPRHYIGDWLHNNRLLLLLDGLDEVNENRRAACVDAINSFTAQNSLTGIVACSRLNEYIQLPNRLNLNSAINLRNLSREQIFEHVAAADQSLAGLRQALERDSSLLILAQTPFMLNMMIQTYRDLPTSAQYEEGFQTIDFHKKTLMEAYVERQFRIAKK